MKQRYFSARDCAKYLGIGKSTYHKFVSDGTLPEGSLLTPGAVRWDIDVLDELMGSTPRQRQSDEQKFFPAIDCAKYLGIGRSTFLKFVSNGTLPKGSHLTPGAVRWDIDVLDELMASRKRQREVRNNA